jgi:hypothetical protein
VLASTAASRGHLPCLTLVLQQTGLHLEPHNRLLGDAAEGGHIDCLKWLDEAGSPWNGDEDVLAAESGSGQALEFCLKRLYPSCNWDEAMDAATQVQSLECMQALYAFFYELKRSREGKFPPVVLAVSGGCVRCVEYALDRSGRPSVEHLDTAAAARAGEEMLRKVVEIGEPDGLAFHPDTTLEAARKGHVGALQYALERKAALDIRTFEISIRNGSVECLKCAHMHTSLEGLELKDLKLHTTNLDVLKYVFAHMGPLWTNAVAVSTAEDFSKNYICLAQDPQGVRGVRVRWQMALLLARVLKIRLPAPLDELVRVRRERAAAFASVFWKAGFLTKKNLNRPSALIDVLGRTPVDVRQLIASQAHLVLRLSDHVPGLACLRSDGPV